MKSTLLLKFSILLACSTPTSVFAGEDVNFETIDIPYTEQANDIINMINENLAVVKEHIGWTQSTIAGWISPWQALDLPYPHETIQRSFNILSFDKFLESKGDELSQNDIDDLISIHNTVTSLLNDIKQYQKQNEENQGTAYQHIADELKANKKYLKHIAAAIPQEIGFIRSGELTPELANQMLAAQKKIRSAAQSIGLAPENFQFTIVPYSGQIYVQNGTIFRGGTSSVNLNDYHINKIIYSEKSRQDKEEILAGNYKIHLMPKSDDETITLVQQIIAATAKDPKLQKAIHSIKFAVDMKELQEAQKRIAPELAEVIPIVVIYPAIGKEYAQYVLDEIYQLFKDTPGSDSTPRFNDKVTSLIYYAQGDGDRKRKPWLEYFDDNKGYVFYRPNFPEGVVDHSLKIPGKEQ